MAVISEIKGTKLSLKLDKGTQTVSNCNASATNEQLYKLAEAVGTLTEASVASVVKVVETTLAQG